MIMTSAVKYEFCMSLLSFSCAADPIELTSFGIRSSFFIILSVCATIINTTIAF